MKILTASGLIACAALTFSVPGLAADKMEQMGHNAKPVQAPAETPLVDGLVKKVDQAAGKLTISHGPLPNGMPGMTMAFKVKEAAWLEQIKEGQKIRFAADEVKGVMTVVRFEPAK